MIEIHPTGDGSLHPFRHLDVTASVASALLGVNPYISAYGLYLYKSGLVTDKVEENAAMRRGTLLEPIAVQILREDHPEIILGKYPVGLYYRDPQARLGATPDVLATDAEGRLGVIEIKSLEGSVFRREWMTESGEIEPPLGVVVQTLIQAHLTGAEWAKVAVIVVGFGIELSLIPIPIHRPLIDRIKHEVAKFWQCVEAGTPPEPDYGRDGALIERLYPRDDGTEIDLSGDNMAPELVASLELARADKKDADMREKTAKAAIFEKMGNARFARLADGRRISAATVSRDGYAVEPTSYRAIKILNGRKA